MALAAESSDFAISRISGSLIAILFLSSFKERRTTSMEVMTNGTGKSRAQLKREKRKVRKHKDREEMQRQSQNVTPEPTSPSNGTFSDAPIEVESLDPSYAEYQKIFNMFNVTTSDDEDVAAQQPKELGQKAEIYYSDDDDVPIGDVDENANPPKLSKKKARRANKLTVAELKTLVDRPDVVEWTDVDAQDPKLLVYLKSYRNTIPVPAHWAFKRDYLATKRGVEKGAFELPAFIRATGIMEMREVVREKEDGQKLRQKMRERVQPKMGKLDVDYQKLHDAFFKYQTKPVMTGVRRSVL